jgi:hypothetical protein
MSKGPWLSGLPADDPRLLKHYRLPTDEGVLSSDAAMNRRIREGSARLLQAIRQYESRVA